MKAAKEESVEYNTIPSLTEDEVEFIQNGIQTVGTLNYKLRQLIPKNWYINWPKYCAEKENRIEIITSEPLVRKFKLPIIYKPKAEICE